MPRLVVTRKRVRDLCRFRQITDLTRKRQIGIDQQILQTHKLIGEELSETIRMSHTNLRILFFLLFVSRFLFCCKVFYKTYLYHKRISALLTCMPNELVTTSYEHLIHVIALAATEKNTTVCGKKVLCKFLIIF